MTGDDVALAARVVVAIDPGRLRCRQAARGASGRAEPSREQLGGYAWIAVLVALALPVYELVLAVLLLVVDAAWPSWLALATFVVFTVVLVRRIVHQRPATVQLLRRRVAPSATSRSARCCATRGSSCSP